MPTSRFLASFALCATIVLGAALTGCPGSLENPERFDLGDGGGQTDTGAGPSCPDVPTAIFAPSCSVEGCHSAKDQLGKLDLETSPIGPRLVGQKANGGAGLLIDPATPDDSVLLTKLRKPPPFGSQMPLGASLTEEQIQCVRAWIVEQIGSAGDAGPTDTGAADTGGDDAASDAASD